MRKIFIYSIAALFIPAISFSQNFACTTLSDLLTDGANVVCRYSEMHIKIYNEKKAELYEKHVYTILNEAGDDFADYQTSYDKFTSINDINGTLYSADGKKLKEVKKKDISDHSHYDGYSLMSDDRYKEHNFYYKNYPYTVEYDEDDDWNQLFYLPTWSPQESHLMSVEDSKLVVETPTNFAFRYKEINLQIQPTITHEKDRTIYTWEVKNITAKKAEDFQPSWQKILPAVLLAPSNFQVNDYKGNMDTWLSLGQFINELRKGKDVLPDNIKQQVHALTDNLTNPKQKIDTLYKFLQQNSRYISVQLGIGGWQPFDANYVATNKYGDCKALSNYMVALLGEAGIKADYVLINAGENKKPIYDNFPIHQFNHATVCVPLGKDSVWLECTSSTTPAGYAGNFTGDRRALLIDDEGGHVVNTPQYTAKENEVARNITATLDEGGNLIADVVSNYSACETDDMQVLLDYAPKTEIEKELKTEFDIPTYDVSKYTYAATKSSEPKLNEALQINAEKYAAIMGKRVFLMPNFITHGGAEIDTSEKRNYDIVLNSSFTHIDTTTISLPAEYTIESMPKDVELKTKYGEYSIHFLFQDKTIQCIRYHQQNAATFSASDYIDFSNFMNKIYKADRSKIVFIKNA